MAQFMRKEFNVYTPELAKYKAMSEGKDIMQEYLNMRKVAQERLRKLSIGGFEANRLYSDNINRFPRKREITDAAMLYDAIADVSHFLTAKQSTVGGIHAAMSQAQQTFEAHYGAEGLQGLDWQSFGEMMRSIKSSAKSQAYYSGWQKAYRRALSRSKKLGLSAEELNEAVSEGSIKIDAGGRLRNASGRFI